MSLKQTWDAGADALSIEQELTTRCQLQCAQAGPPPAGVDRLFVTIQVEPSFASVAARYLTRKPSGIAQTQLLVIAHWKPNPWRLAEWMLVEESPDKRRRMPLMNPVVTGRWDLASTGRPS